MILIAHLLLGAVIASKIKYIPLSITLSFLSHYILDAIPHIEYPIENIKNRQWLKAFPDFLRVFLDFSLGILLILIFSNSQPIIFIVAFFAVLPDILNILNMIFRNRLLQIHSNFHEKNHFLKHKKISNLWRISSQIIIIIISVILLKF
ncbi:MAG: hypothetical protein AAB352_00900 [Patescibacteria group bacterium]